MIIFKSRIEREKITVEKMIRLYCKLNHENNLCGYCDEIIDYAMNRLDKCPYSNDKPACTNCPVHCYNKQMRDKIKEIMRFSGPKMMFHHPVLAVFHIYDNKIRNSNPKLPKT